MAAGSSSFGLRSWRLPLRRQLPLLVPLTAIYLVVGVPMLGVLIHSFGVEIREAPEFRLRGSLKLGSEAEWTASGVAG
jgi:hypothetical protein